MSEEINSDNELEERNSKNAHLKKKKSSNTAGVSIFTAHLLLF